MGAIKIAQFVRGHGPAASVFERLGAELDDMERDRFCCVCETATGFFVTGLILDKYSVRFFRCPNCGFIQTENPHWLQEAYATPIVTSDVGYVSRNLAMWRMTLSVFALS